MEMAYGKCPRPRPDSGGTREDGRGRCPHQGGAGTRRPEGGPMTNKTLHQTRKGADISLAKRQISPASYRAVLDGKISLHAARELGRDQEPDDISDAADAPGQGQEISGAPQEQPAVVPTGPRLTSRIS